LTKSSFAHRNTKDVAQIEEILPWEASLFAFCSRDNPSFIKPVLHSTGLPSLHNALKRLLRKDIPTPQMDWESIVLILRSLAFSSEQDWLFDTDTEILGEGVVRSLIDILRYVHTCVDLEEITLIL